MRGAGSPGANSIVGGTGGIALTLSGHEHTAHLVGPPLITAVAGRYDFKIAQNERLPDLGQSALRDPTVRGSNGAGPAFDAARRTPGRSCRTQDQMSEPGIGGIGREWVGHAVKLKGFFWEPAVSATTADAQVQLADGQGTKRAAQVQTAGPGYFMRLYVSSARRLLASVR